MITVPPARLQVVQVLIAVVNYFISPHPLPQGERGPPVHIQSTSFLQRKATGRVCANRFFPIQEKGVMIQKINIKHTQTFEPAKLNPISPHKQHTKDID